MGLRVVEVEVQTVPSFRTGLIDAPELAVGEIVSVSDPRIDVLESSEIESFQKPISHFPIITVNGEPWHHAVSYLLEKATEFSSVSSSTLKGIAIDLALFLRWSIKNNVNYLECSRRPLSPIRLYRRSLLSEDYKPSTVTKKLSRLVSFYRWLQKERGIKFDFPLWEEQKVTIVSGGGNGKRILQNVKSTDVQRVPGSSHNSDNGFDGTIADGARLTPYNKEEQKIIVRCLFEIGNTEMSLSFLIAIFTGARLQTIFTLRECNFSSPPNFEKPEQVLYVGAGWSKPNAKKEMVRSSELVDTKQSKRQKIFFPNWLYEKIQIYIASERYKNRKTKAQHDFIEPSEQYLFLTTRGKPYYCAKNDKHRIEYPEPPKGGSVHQFIEQQLRPRLLRKGFRSKFRFHNLRATYGMNIVRSWLPRIGEPGALTIGELFSYVRVRMNHSDIEVTQRYLDFDKNSQIAEFVQTEYEAYLDDLIGEVLESI